MQPVEALRVTRADVLRAARERVERGWCQRGAAQKEDGEWCLPRHPKAVRWCASGAVCAEVPVQYGLVLDHFFAPLDRFLDGQRLVAWNDEPGRTREEVLDLFDLAIEAVA